MGTNKSKVAKQGKYKHFLKEITDRSIETTQDASGVPQSGHLYNMRRIGELLGDTGKEIEDLDSKLDHVLEKNEKDFLTAYRFHMLKV